MPPLGTHRRFGGKLYLRVAWHKDKKRIEEVAKEQRADGSRCRVFKHNGIWYVYRMLTMTVRGKTYAISGDSPAFAFLGGKKRKKA